MNDKPKAGKPKAGKRKCICRPARRHRDCAYCGSGWDDGKVCGACKAAGVDGQVIRGTGRVCCKQHKGLYTEE
jgi:hypothetical protein